MSDPATIGALVISAFAKAAEAGLGEAAKSTAKDAYETLKKKLSHWAGREVATLEAAPDSEKTRRAVTEIIDRQPEEELLKLRALTQALIVELRNSGVATGLDLRDLTNVEVELDGVKAGSNGVGARVERMQGGKITAKNVSAGNNSGN